MSRDGRRRLLGAFLFFYIQSKGLYKGQGIAVILVHIMARVVSAGDVALAGASGVWHGEPNF